MASISFTDAVGAAVLTNGKPAPADRFANWIPDPLPYGTPARRQADGLLTMIRLRDDFAASFELRQIPVKLTGGLRLVDIAARLVYHLNNGGICSVTTGDLDANVYANCQLMDGGTASVQLANPRTLEYTLSLALVNVDAVPVRMVCHYR